MNVAMFANKTSVRILSRSGGCDKIRIVDHPPIIWKSCYRPYVYNKCFCVVDYKSSAVRRLHGLAEYIVH